MSLPSRPELPDGAAVPDTPPPRPAEPAGGRNVPVWVPFAVLAAVTLIIGMFGLLVVALATVGDSRIDQSDPPDSITFGLTAVQGVAFIGAAWIAVRAVRPDVTARWFGLVRPDWRVAIGWAVGLYAAFWALTGVLVLLFGEPPEQTIVADLRGQDSVVALIGFAAVTCVVAPVCEEFFFRGFMFGVFRRRLGVAWATVLTGAVFGAVHAPGAPSPGLVVVVLGLFGAALCLIYWRSGSIIPCMALHAIHNSISFAATKDFSVAGSAALILGVAGLVVGGATAVSRTRSGAVAR